VNENKNLILAVVLSALVLLGWSLLSERFVPSNPPPVKVEDGKVKPLPPPEAGPVAQTPTAMRNRAVILRETPRVRIQTPSLQGSINLQGGRIDDLVLVRERQGIAKDSPPVRLLSPAGAPQAYFASFGWSGQGVQAPPADARWTASAPVLSPRRPVTLSWTNPTGQRFEIIYSVDENYLFTVRQRVANPTGSAVSVQPYGLVSRAAKSHDPDSWTVHVGPIGVFNDAANYGVDFSTLDENPSGEHFSTNGGWLGFTDTYWLTALAPAGASPRLSARLQAAPIRPISPMHRWSWSQARPSRPRAACSRALRVRRCSTSTRT